MKTQHFIYCLAVIAVLFTACKKDKDPEKGQDIPVTGITLNNTELMLAPGDTITLIATVEPADATNKTVTWTSSNYAVTTVNDNGLITALVEGEATIAVTTEDGKKTATCLVKTVNEDYRDKWVGTYDFITISAIGYWMPGTDWDYTHDTVNFIGTIERFEKDRLKITFKPNATEPNWNPQPNISTFPVPINGLIYPRVCNFGDIDYPEYRCDKGEFSGCFMDNNIKIFYTQSAGHYGREQHEIRGTKNK